MQFFISFIPLDFPDSTKRPVESGFWIFFCFACCWLVGCWGRGGSGVALVLFWVCLFGVFFFVSAAGYFQTLCKALGLFVFLLSNGIMILIKMDWFLEKARTDWDWEADQLGSL